MNEQEAMERALTLSRQGWGRVHPNPMVGAVVVRDGVVLGEAFHAELGGEHAEPLALARAGADARGATLAVTLEPCRHFGKQPPCVNAILRAGVRRVVVATADPNPAAAGGAAVLRAAGIEVEIGLLEAEARRQNAAFFHRHLNAERPWVALKLATSVDHKIADGSGRSRWIAGPAAREFVHSLRAGFDAIAVGGRTALADDPSLTVRGSVVPRVAPVRVLFEGRTPLPPTLAALAGAGEVRTIVVTGAATAAETGARLAGTAAEIVAADSPVEALGALRELGIASVLVEGGGRLAGALLRAGLVDRLYSILAPVWLGDSGVPATSGWDVPSLEQAERWEVIERRALGNDTLLVMDRTPCSPGS